MYQNIVIVYVQQDLLSWKEIMCKERLTQSTNKCFIESNKTGICMQNRTGQRGAKSYKLS